MTAEEMYQEFILDLYRNPSNKGALENPQIKARDVNHSCGDIIEIHANVNGSSIKDIKFSGKGCAISQASTELLVESVKNKHLEEIKNITKEQVLEMLGIPISAFRLKCALLGLKVLKLGVYNYLGEKLEDDNLS
ncbi:MAG: iron-sulfur cluster assembly scaffold protein [Candidatus Woesearchaeota archaeon]|nr:MAG: iron-sulfur cluster assembly scaffold protein [Candidatus Woesearchaeota archaeon]